MNRETKDALVGTGAALGYTLFIIAIAKWIFTPAAAQQLPIEPLTDDAGTTIAIIIAIAILAAVAIARRRRRGGDGQ